MRAEGFKWFRTVFLILCLAIGGQGFTTLLEEKVSDKDSVPGYPSCPEKIEPEKWPLFYPNLMAIDSTSGQVALRFLINQFGETSNIIILSSSGGRNERAFRISARRMVEDRKYLPIKRPCEHSESITFDMGG